MFTQNVTIETGDWKDCVNDDSNGFFFFDPPYRDSLLIMVMDLEMMN